MTPSPADKLLFDAKTKALDLVLKQIGRTTSHSDIGADHTIEHAARSRVVKVYADGLQASQHASWLPQPALEGLIGHRSIVIKINVQSPDPGITVLRHNPLLEHKVYDRARHTSSVYLTRAVVGPDHETNGFASLWASTAFDMASGVHVDVLFFKAYNDVRDQRTVPTQWFRAPIITCGIRCKSASRSSNRS